MKKYCILDCEIVAQSIYKFSISLPSLGSPVSAESLLTISSTAIQLYVTKYNTQENPIIIIPSQTSTSAWLKEGYIGGRTKVFHRGMNMDKVYHFDVPGIYARCIQERLPIGNPV
jgi:hypothetical protein